MLSFYKKALVTFGGLFAVNLLLAAVCLDRVYYSDELFPARQSVIPWQLETITDVQKGGSSTVQVNESGRQLDYDYVLTRDVQFPHVTAIFAFSELHNAHSLVDLSAYSSASLKVKCEPENLLSLHLHSYDPEITDTSNFSSYRIAESLATCKQDWTRINIELPYMNVPEWWLYNYDLDVSDQTYWLDKVIAFSIGTSLRGPVNTKANVIVSEFTLHGRDWRFLWVLLVLSTLLWGVWLIWLFKNYTASLVAHAREKLLKDRPLMAYQQLSIEPHKDREKSAILRFMATEYANPDMNLEYAIASLGINRTKINALLKEELGLTFSTYLNKLRLVEAARLLTQENANVGEIAWSVGYNNVSWFNKLFKQEYGCTPKTFKNINQSTKNH